MLFSTEEGELCKPSSEFRQLMFFLAGCMVRGYDEDCLQFDLDHALIYRITSELTEIGIEGEYTPEQEYERDYELPEGYLNINETLGIDYTMHGDVIISYNNSPALYDSKEVCIRISSDGDISEITAIEYNENFSNILTSSLDFQ